MNPVLRSLTTLLLLVALFPAAHAQDAKPARTPDPRVVAALMAAELFY